MVGRRDGVGLKQILTWQQQKCMLPCPWLCDKISGRQKYVSVINSTIKCFVWCFLMRIDKLLYGLQIKNAHLYYKYSYKFSQFNYYLSPNLKLIPHYLSPWLVDNLAPMFSLQSRKRPNHSKVFALQNSWNFEFVTIAVVGTVNNKKVNYCL